LSVLAAARIDVPKVRYVTRVGTPLLPRLRTTTLWRC